MKIINVENLSYTYPKNKEATIKNVNFSIDKGEIFGFLGPSGAGKSTTQKIIIGILKHFQGNVKVMDYDLKNVTGKYYERIGVAFEFPNLYTKFTALENLNYFASLYSDETTNPEYLLDMVGLKEHKNIRVSNFSKGMKVRLNFCRALLNKPDVVFLDEPTSGLDPSNAKNIKNIILDLKSKGKTIFITTHNMTVAETICDRVAFIVDGSINLIDSPRNLKLKRSEKLLKVEFKEGNESRTVEFNINNIGYNERFLKLLKEKDIETIHTQEATLEDIFIDVTGRKLV